MMKNRDIHSPRPFTSSSMSERPSSCSSIARRHEVNCPWKLLLSHFPPVPSYQQFHDRFPASAVDANSENASSVTACAPHDCFPTALYFRRHASVSSRHTQRTQSTLEAVPSFIVSAVTRRQNTHRKPSITSTTESSTRCITPLQFFKRTLGQGNRVTGTDAYQWYASQASESSCGFQYATTPSIGNSHDSENDTAETHPIEYGTRTLQPRLTPTPVRTKNKSHTHLVMGSVKFLEDLASKLRGIVHTGHKAENASWKASVKGRNRNGTRYKTETGASSPNKRRRTKTSASADRDMYEARDFAWGNGEKILRVKNNDTGSCVFMVKSGSANPQEALEIPLPYAYLRSHLFARSESLCRSLEDWNRHFQEPPIHWTVNFVPKAYLRKGWHLAEEVAGYLRMFGFDGGNDASGVQGGRWRVEYEAIGHKPCLVDEDGSLPGVLMPPSYGHICTPRNISLPQRHPSRFWERKEEWDGGLAVGIAL